MVALVAERLKVRIDEDDPAFVLVELNRLALEETARAVVDQLQALPDRIDDAARRLIFQVDATVARRTAEAMAEITKPVDGEGQRAPNVAVSTLKWVAGKHLPSTLNSYVAAALVGAVLIVGGYAAGYLHADTRADGDGRRAAVFLASAEGRAGLRLAELGQATALLNCSGAGWVVRDGFCFGTPRDGKTVGWRLK